jgi:hypothetical protein
VFGCDVEGVEIARCGMAELDRGIVLLSLQRGRRRCGGVAGQDLFQHLGSGAELTAL